MTTDAGQTHRSNTSLWTVVLRNRFAVLLCALILLLIGSPLVRVFGPGKHPKLVALVITMLFAAMLLSAVFAVSQTRKTQIIALLLVFPSLAIQGLETWLQSDGLVIAEHVLNILFLSYVIVLILKFLLLSHRVSSDMIYASLCVYLLLGILGAIVYSLFYYLDPTSFAFAFAEDGGDESMRFGGEQTSIAIYYSFVTLSTLGYGDIVPISSLARTFAALQAVVGQLYLAVLVARLVGLHIVRASESDGTQLDNQ